MSDDVVETVEAKTSFGSLKVSSANLNTIFTAFAFVMLCIVSWVLWSHTVDAKDTGKEVAGALKEANKETATVLKEANKDLTQILKELTQAAREQNCLMSMPEAKRPANAELCKRISR